MSLGKLIIVGGVMLVTYLYTRATDSDERFMIGCCIGLLLIVAHAYSLSSFE